MCLLIKSKAKTLPKPKVAKQDITCYKVLSNPYCDFYQTPVICEFVPKEVINGELPFEPKTNKIETCEIGSGYTIGEGMIHTCADIQSAQDSIKDFDVDHPQIYECIIPKGTKCYKGFHGLNKPLNGYTSKQIMFKKLITNIKQ